MTTVPNLLAGKGGSLVVLRLPPESLESSAYHWDVTKLLNKAFEAASDLPAAEQDELAARILDEVAWERSSEVGAGREKLRQMVEQARADIQVGRVRELRPEDL